MNIVKWNAAALLALFTLAISAPASAAPQSTDKPDNHVVQAKDAIVKGAKVVGTKTKDGLSKTGEVMTDGWITTRVNSRFVNEDLLKGSDINVDTDNHVVTLTGTVTTTAGRNKAVAVAKGTEGVRRVVNRLAIGLKK
jgi:hyperosmotically inducible periplasmic protein